MLRKLKKLTSQRGAMFGLDARIALAIFGTLTVATGYMGMSKLQTASDAALYKEIFAIEDALDQMQADLGVFHMFAIDNSDFVNDLLALNDSSLIKAQYRARWNGPYLEGFNRNHPKYGSYDVRYRGGCDISSTCTVMLRLTNVPLKTWQNFNRMVDENNGNSVEGAPTTQGIVQANTTSDPLHLYYYTKVKRNAG